MTRRFLAAALLVSVTCLLASCHARKPDGSPTKDRSDDPIYELASHVSGQVDGVLVVQNLETLLGQIDKAEGFELVGTDAPQEAAGQIIAGALGFDPRQPRGWRSKGVRTDAPLMVAFVGDDPALLIPLADPEVFDAYMAKRATSYDRHPHPRRFYRRTPGGSSSGQHDERGFPIWTVRDGVACVSLRGRRRDVDLNCLGDRAFEGSPLAQSEAFLAFRDGPMRHADIGLFSPSYNDVTVEGVVRQLAREDVLAVDTLMRALSETEGLSMVGRIEDGTMSVEARLGLTADGREAVGRLLETPSTVELDGIIPPDAVAALRVGINPETAWQWLLDSLHWESRVEFRQGLERFRERFDVALDIEKDLVEQWSGEAILLVQPAPDPPAQMSATSGAAGQPPRHHQRYALIDDGLAISIIIAFDDPVAPPRLLEKLRKISHSGNSRRRVTIRDHEAAGRTITVAEFAAQHMPRILIDRKRVMIAPSLLPIEDVARALIGGNPSVSSTPARRVVADRGPAAGFFDFQRFFEFVLPPERAEGLGDLPDRMEYIAGGVRLERRALVAEATLVDTSFIRLATTTLFGARVRQWSSAPRYRLQRMARRATTYYTRYQRACSRPDACNEPWHADKSGRVDREDRVFPGGTDQRLTTHKAPPVGGRVAEYAVEARNYGTKTSALLRLEIESAGRFQYIYETNGVAGPGASFTITAVADLDPTSPQKHTFEITGTVGKDHRVDVSSVEERHPFE